MAQSTKTRSEELHARRRSPELAAPQQSQRKKEKRFNPAPVQLISRQNLKMSCFNNIINNVFMLNIPLVTEQAQGEKQLHFHPYLFNVCPSTVPFDQERLQKRENLEGLP